MKKEKYYLCFAQEIKCLQKDTITHLHLERNKSVSSRDIKHIQTNDMFQKEITMNLCV